MKQYLYKPNYLINLSKKLKLMQDEKNKRGFFTKLKNMIIKRIK
jgi:hypothetical protein